jgi:hypothetical protein
VHERGTGDGQRGRETKTLLTLHSQELPLRRTVTAILEAVRRRHPRRGGYSGSRAVAARLQLRDSAGLAPDFPHFSLTPSGEALCYAFSCEGTLPRGSEVVKDACIAVYSYGTMAASRTRR